jgi:hypothetical protein
MMTNLKRTELLATANMLALPIYFAAAALVLAAASGRFSVMRRLSGVGLQLAGVIALVLAAGCVAAWHMGFRFAWLIQAILIIGALILAFIPNLLSSEISGGPYVLSASEYRHLAARDWFQMAARMPIVIAAGALAGFALVWALRLTSKKTGAQ